MNTAIAPYAVGAPSLTAISMLACHEAPHPAGWAGAKALSRLVGADVKYATVSNGAVVFTQDVAQWNERFWIDASGRYVWYPGGDGAPSGDPYVFLRTAVSA